MHRFLAAMLSTIAAPYEAGRDRRPMESLWQAGERLRAGVPISRRETSRSRIGPRMPTAPRQPSPYERAGSAGINAMVERVAPAILELLADGVPRTKPAIVEALAGRHDKQDVVHALNRLAPTEP
jgi:hypothetical protein